MEENFDIIVVGAGFGGPVAAKICAEAGLKTLIIERSENVGDKVISGLTIPFYGFLFGPEFIRDGNPPFERPADGIINYIIRDIEKGVIDIDDSLRVPKPFSPIIAFGYNTYCKP
ncbi:MAG: FAD-dependent oxidoreductase, partial [Candidatus Lokiarchaeota archaeon]|nr:FAD-dependent oxidoreductase [Candidatus Lokiarchaeota archaeon]